MKSILPVFPGLDNLPASMIAKDQPEYQTLPAYVHKDGTVVTRWKLDWSERLEVFLGGCIWLSILTFGRRLQPIKLEVAPPEFGPLHAPYTEDEVSALAMATAPKRWFDFDPENESIQEFRERRRRQMPELSDDSIKQLVALRRITWDGDLISKVARDCLIRNGLAVRYGGWQVISEEGIAVLDAMGLLKP